MQVTTATIPDAAQAYLSAGLRALPASRESKRPIRAVGKWKPYIDRSPTEAELTAWFANNPDALCIVCGQVSGQVEMIDFDAGGIRDLRPEGVLIFKWSDCCVPKKILK